MINLTFNVDGQFITRTDENRVVSDSINFVDATFTFSDEWVGVKTAIFKKSNVVESVILVDDSCNIPSSVMVGKGCLEVTVFCGERITANSAEVLIEQSGFIDVEPSPPEEVTQTYVRSYSDERGVNLIKYENGKIYFYNGLEWLTISNVDLTVKNLKQVEANISLTTDNIPDFSNKRYLTEQERDDLKKLVNIPVITNEPTGFYNDTNVTISLDTTARTITLNGTGFEAYYKGNLVAELVDGWESPQYGTDDGVYYLF